MNSPSDTNTDSLRAEETIFRRVLLLVAYDGRNYSGFARQTNAPTIAGALDTALRDIDPEASFVTGASRTDAGVHAAHQPVSFTTKKQLKSRGWVLALSQRLPEDITILRASYVPLSFDPRRDPIWKRYRYRLFCSQVEDPFISPLSWRVGDELDLALMQDEASSLVGEHDFAAFRSVDDCRTETTRTLTEVSVTRAPEDPRIIDITVQGNRFMYNMVRIIAGTLVDVGRGKRPPGAGRRALNTLDRRQLGVTAPARGLLLSHVELRTWGEDPWPEA